MACNYFSVIIFNMENFANKDIRVKRGGPLSFINFYHYYLIHSKQWWFSSCCFHFCMIIMFLIFIYTVFNVFLCSELNSSIFVLNFPCCRVHCFCLLVAISFLDIDLNEPSSWPSQSLA